MTNWGKFANVNAAQLNEGIKALGDGEYPEIPNGRYEVAIDSMVLKPTKKTGAPMLAVRFTILEGEFKNSKLFMNQVVLMGDEHDSIRVSTANRFLKSLGTDIPVSFEGVGEYEALIEQIAETIESQGLEYLLEMGENKGGYKTYTIREVYEK